jgi:uncharacterized repeat protein (TIGR01451 family)
MMKGHRTRRFAAIALLVALLTHGLRAELVETYTNRAAFLADLTGTSDTFDAESLPAGTNFAILTLSGLSVSNAPPCVLMEVVDGHSQTTAGGSNSLGVESVDKAFLSGERCVMTFGAPSLAVGLYAIGSPGDVRPGDFTLTAGSTVASNGAAPDVVLPDGGEAYFVGIIVRAPDVGSAFSEATLASHDPSGKGLFVFNVDDITWFLPNLSDPANLMVYKSGPAEADLGSNIVYSLTIVNAGPSPAWSVVATDPTPPGLTFVETSGIITSTFPASVSIVPAGHAVVLSSTYQVPRMGYTGPALVTNTLSVTAATPDPDPGQETASCTTRIDPHGDWDSDGLSNEDEITYRTDPRDTDSDGDTLGDGDEITADTDPAAAGSVLAITGIRESGGMLTIDWTGGTWATQYLEYLTDVTSTPALWTAWHTNIPPTPSPDSQAHPLGTDRMRFYRIRVVR